MILNCWLNGGPLRCLEIADLIPIRADLEYSVPCLVLRFPQKTLKRSFSVDASKFSNSLSYSFSCNQPEKYSFYMYLFIYCVHICTIIDDVVHGKIFCIKGIININSNPMNYFLSTGN